MFNSLLTHTAKYPLHIMYVKDITKQNDYTKSIVICALFFVPCIGVIEDISTTTNLF